MALISKASLLMVPSTYEPGTLFNVLPSGNRAPDSTDQNSGYDQTRADFDFDRGSNAAATRVNADGLIEKYRENLVTHSNNFSDSDWTKVNCTPTSGFEGYDGTNNAWKLTALTSGTSQIKQTHGTSGMITHSVYAKAGTIDVLKIWVGLSAEFNLITGATSYSQSKMTDVGDGWWRCEVYLAYTIINPFFSATTAGDYIYIQDAQAEAGTIATDYLESTSVTGKAGVLVDLPRINFDANGENGSLLLEPSRQQLVQYSEYFGASSWQNVGCTITENQTTSPEGLSNATLIAGTSSGGTRVQDYLGALTGNHTFSIYIKSTGSATRFNFQTNDIGGATFSVPASGAPTLYAQGTNVGEPFIEDAGNGWYRVGFTFAPTGGAVSNYFQLYPDSAGNSSSIYAFGAMAEAGSYPSSYIPNHSGTGGVTRAADSCSVTGASDVIGQTEGTMFGEFTFKSAEQTNRLFSISGADWNTIGHIRFDMINLRPQTKIRTTGADVAEIIGTEDIAIGSLVKFAVVYTSTQLKMFVNGSQIGSTDTLSGSLPSPMNEIVVDALGGAFNSNTQNNQLNPYKQAIVFKEALTDAECVTLTTL